MHEFDNNIPPIVCGFHTKSGWGTHLVFLKTRFQGYKSDILSVISLLEEKFTFSASLGQLKFQKF